MLTAVKTSLRPFEMFSRSTWAATRTESLGQVFPFRVARNGCLRRRTSSSVLNGHSLSSHGTLLIGELSDKALDSFSLD